MPKMGVRHAEDYVVGEIADVGEHCITKEEIVAFSQKWDPQPFHLDEDFAQQTHFKGLVASGWHVALIMMGMLWRSGFISPETSEGSPGHEKLKWLKPVRPNDCLRGRVETTGVRLSRSRPNIGLVRTIATLDNQFNEQVYWLDSTSIIKSRTAKSV